MTTKNLDRYRGCLLGLAAGDAVGTTLEFKTRGTFAPLTDMIGGGPFHLQPGQWTDDTSMALCLATSLVEKNGFDAVDQMQRYLRWYEQGYLSSTGKFFDIGAQTSQALHEFRTTGNPFCGPIHPSKSGNGSLMRLAPVAMFYASDLASATFFAGESSRTTHGSPECMQACKLYAEMLVRALEGQGREAILAPGSLPGQISPKISAIARGEYKPKTAGQIRGSGYVVDALEAALWCFWTTGSFSEAVLVAANLGDDADTTAAICGQIAGAFYGRAGIPAHWLEILTLRDEITRLADRLAEHT